MTNAAQIPEATRSVEFELTLEDYHALIAHLCGPVNPRPKRLALLGVGAAWFALVLFGLQWERPAFWTFVAGALVGILFLFIVARVIMMSRKALRPVTGGAILCPYTVVPTEAGVDIRTPSWCSLTHWSAVQAVEETDAHVFLRIDPTAAYTVPKRAFASEGALQAFVESARLYVERMRAGAPAV